jgi:molybdopterin synthase catalytic subunit
MAERKLREIGEEIRQRWDAPCAILHRVGRLEIGEASVVIAVAAPHRKDAFDACRHAIERIKEIVPIWKKEFAASGEWWVEGGASLTNEPMMVSLPNARDA